MQGRKDTVLGRGDLVLHRSQSVHLHRHRLPQRQGQTAAVTVNATDRTSRGSGQDTVGMEGKEEVREREREKVEEEEEEEEEKKKSEEDEGEG